MEKYRQDTNNPRSNPSITQLNKYTHKLLRLTRTPQAELLLLLSHLSLSLPLSSPALPLCVCQWCWCQCKPRHYLERRARSRYSQNAPVLMPCLFWFPRSLTLQNTLSHSVSLFHLLYLKRRYLC